ncbi:MAG: ribonuclease III [Clostridia bacterium]|nr:ribonuclease III [Clostridia bacterium]
MRDLSALMDALGYTFQNQELLEQALTHSSYANEHGIPSNERLEFLGDSVLNLIAGEYLFSLDDSDEGSLSKRRASIVCEKALASYSAEMHVGDYLLLGKGERSSGGAQRESTLEDAFESIVAAIYLDGGMEAARQFALPRLQQELQTKKQHRFNDYKTLLQEIIQQNPEEKLQYVLVNESGPDHNKKFTVEVHLNSNVIGHGKGKSKKEAEQLAAKEALALMGY